MWWELNFCTFCQNIIDTIINNKQTEKRTFLMFFVSWIVVLLLRHSVSQISQATTLCFINISFTIWNEKVSMLEVRERIYHGKIYLLNLFSRKKKWTPKIYVPELLKYGLLFNTGLLGMLGIFVYYIYMFLCILFYRGQFSALHRLY